MTKIKLQSHLSPRRSWTILWFSLCCHRSSLLRLLWEDGGKFRTGTQPSCTSHLHLSVVMSNRRHLTECSCSRLKWRGHNLGSCLASKSGRPTNVFQTLNIAGSRGKLCSLTSGLLTWFWHEITQQVFFIMMFISWAFYACLKSEASKTIALKSKIK